MIRGRTILTALAALGVAAAARAQSDACSGATVLIPGTVYTGTTSGATADGSAVCSGSSNSPDVWFRYTHTEASPRLLVVSLCGSGFDTYLSFHSACPGTPMNQVACNDDSCGLQSQTQRTMNTGDTVYIRVGGYGTAVGSYTMTGTLQDPPPPPTAGPDVTVFDLIDMTNYGAVGTITAYAVGTNACNVGDVPVEWVSGSNHHPVVAQNMYRLKAGRFEQIGQSWLKHTFASTNSPGCGNCQSPPNGGAQLGIGCTDAYGSGLNGNQSGLGPRSQVNVSIGQFPYPFSAPAAAPTIGRRLQVFTDDVTPGLNPSALYFAECQYVTFDDALGNNGRNNATYRQISIASQTTTPGFVGSSFPQQPAIIAWKRADPSVTLTPVDYQDQGVWARFWVGAKATNNGDGTWNYEYAVSNLNSTRAGGVFTIPVPGGASLTNIGFHAPFSHSGEPFSNAAWTNTRSATNVTFSCEPAAVNINGNAIRWGTLYNFRFTANVPPATGDARLGLFLQGDPATLTIGGLPVPSPTCPVDWDVNGTVTAADVGAYVTAWFDSLGAHNTATDFDGNGVVEPRDVALFVTAWMNALTGGC